jgi:hypothetical protein
MPKFTRSIVCSALSAAWLAGCHQNIPAYDRSVTRDTNSLLKKTDMLFAEIVDEAAAGAGKSAASEAIRKDWRDVMSDADALREKVCEKPGNEDECTIASNNYDDLRGYHRVYQAGQFTSPFRNVTEAQIRPNLDRLAHAEEYKRLLGTQGD